MQYQQFLIFFLKQQIPTKTIGNDNIESNVLIKSNKCTNKGANNNIIENENVTIATVSIKRERKSVIT